MHMAYSMIPMSSTSPARGAFICASTSRVSWRSTWAVASTNAAAGLVDDSGASSSLSSDESALQMSAAAEWRVRQEFQRFGRDIADEVAEMAAAKSRSGSATPASLCLSGIRDDLIRQEDSIIFTLIERAQFQRNSAAIFFRTLHFVLS